MKNQHSNNVNTLSSTKIHRIFRIGQLIYKRYFPYAHYFVITVPFFALLFKSNLLIENLWSIRYLLPFLFSMIAGFVYNELCDSKTDYFNAIKLGKVTQKDAKIVIVFSTISSMILALLIYRSLATIVLFSIYVFFSLAYSGLKIRFKTTLLGPFIASLILWTGPALILLADFSLWTTTSIGLLLGIFLVFSAHELHHQIDDYAEDKQMNAKTLAVRVGKDNAFIISAISSAIGFILILFGMYFNIPSIYVVVFSPLLFLYLFFQYIIFRKGIFSSNYLLTFNIPVKAVLIAFACIYLGFASLFTVLILMVFFGEIYGVIQWF